MKVGCWLHGLGTLSETHFSPDPKAGLVGLLPTDPFRLKLNRNHHPLSSFSLLGWRNPLKTAETGVNGPLLQSLRASAKQFWFEEDL